MVVIVDQLANVDNVAVSFGVVGANFKTAYVAQTFKALGHRLTSIEFLIDGSLEAQTDAPEIKYRVLIATIEGTGTNVKPKTVLFQSSVLTEPLDADSNFRKVAVDPGLLALTEGQTYALILEATPSNPTVAGDPVHIGSVLAASRVNATGADYPDGHVLWYAASTPYDQAFAADWQDYLAQDLAFRLTFSVEGRTIKGTKKNDKIDAKDTVKGQPKPTADDDTITGKNGDDTLSGLAGNDVIDGGTGDDKLKGGAGDDLLIGGKGKDILQGQAGKDFFLFNVSLKEPPDRIKGFSTADDTIQLDDKIYSVFDPGAVAAGSFHIGTKAADADDYLVYNPASGALLYDSDAAGGNKGIKIATLDKNLAMTAADFAVV